MRRGLSLFVSLAILATAGWFAWRLVFPAPVRPPLPPVVTNDVPASRPVEIRPDTKPVVADPTGVVADDGVPAAGDRIEGTVFDESGAVVAEADVQIIDLRYSATSTRPPDRRFEERV